MEEFRTLEDYLERPLVTPRRVQTRLARVTKICYPLCLVEVFVTVKLLRYRVAPALVFAVLTVNRLVLVMEQASLISHLLLLLSMNPRVFYHGSDFETDSSLAPPEDVTGRTWWM